MKKIIHIDMDSFFASIEMRDQPELKSKPIAVGGSAQKRGVIATANYLARQYGVKSAMSSAKALQKCPELILIKPRFEVYRAVSAQMRQIMRRYTDKIEFLSLDEAYLEVSDSLHYQGSATRIAQAIRTDIEQELQLTASAGISSVKFLAKIASDMNKPNGQYVILPQAIPEFIKTLPLKKIPGVGKVTEQKLNTLGLYSCADIQNYDLSLLFKQFGKLGKMLYEYSHGIDHRQVEPYKEPKSVGVERTLTQDIYSFSEYEAIFNELYTELEARLSKKSENRIIANQSVKLKFEDFQSVTQQHRYPKLDKADLFKLATKLWYEKRQQRGVRLVGLQVQLQSTQAQKQLSFFDSEFDPEF